MTLSARREKFGEKFYVDVEKTFAHVNKTGNSVA